MALLASGGSTNHSMHLVAIARAAGILLNWDDIADLSAAVPLLAKVYPNGQADVNHFHAAGGTSCLFRQLLDAGYMHGDANTADGYNPCRITKSGIDWERPELKDPWANIGYWGDHQIIYLSKFLGSVVTRFLPTAQCSEYALPPIMKPCFWHTGWQSLATV